MRQTKQSVTVFEGSWKKERGNFEKCKLNKANYISYCQPSLFFGGKKVCKVSSMKFSLQLYVFHLYEIIFDP